MKLTKEEIAKINKFLIRHHVKFIDARIELIDHLVLEYEAGKQEEKVHAFLMKKRDFIKLFIRERQKQIHWSYQKKLLQQIVAFFYKPKLLMVTLGMGFILFYLKENNLFSVARYMFFGSIIIPLGITLYLQLKETFKLKNIQSFQSVCSLMALPSLFLYMYTPFKSFLQIEESYFYMYWFVAFLFNVSGLIVFKKMITETKEEYNQIISAN